MLRRIISVVFLLAFLMMCAACGQRNTEPVSGSEWTYIDGGQEAEEPLSEEEESGNGLVTIEGVYLNTQFSTEYQHLIYVVYSITNDSEEDIPVPQADPETGTGSAASLKIGSSAVYEDLYPYNDWMRESIEESGSVLSSGEGTVIPAGSMVRMISCFQIETEEIDEETPLRLIFHSGTTRLSASASYADIQRVTDTGQLLEKLK